MKKSNYNLFNEIQNIFKVRILEVPVPILMEILEYFSILSPISLCPGVTLDAAVGAAWNSCIPYGSA